MFLRTLLHKETLTKQSKDNKSCHKKQYFVLFQENKECLHHIKLSNLVCWNLGLTFHMLETMTNYVCSLSISGHPCLYKKWAKVWNQGLQNNPWKKGDFEHKFQYPFALFVREKKYKVLWVHAFAAQGNVLGIIIHQATQPKEGILKCIIKVHHHSLEMFCIIHAIRHHPASSGLIRVFWWFFSSLLTSYPEDTCKHLLSTIYNKW